MESYQIILSRVSVTYQSNSSFIVELGEPMSFWLENIGEKYL